MVIDTLELKIIVDNMGTTARINNTTNALKNLHKVICHKSAKQFYADKQSK